MKGSAIELRLGPRGPASGTRALSWDAERAGRRGRAWLWAVVGPPRQLTWPAGLCSVSSANMTQRQLTPGTGGPALTQESEEMCRSARL